MGCAARSGRGGQRRCGSVHTQRIPGRVLSPTTPPVGGCCVIGACGPRQGPDAGNQQPRPLWLRSRHKKAIRADHSGPRWGSLDRSCPVGVLFVRKTSAADRTPVAERSGVRRAERPAGCGGLAVRFSLHALSHIQRRGGGGVRLCACAACDGASTTPAPQHAAERLPVFRCLL